MISARVLADSLSVEGYRLTTLEVTMPRIILAEFNTHRQFSRNSASSRAIPVEKRILAAQANPFVPAAFGKNQKGMQASENLGTQEDQAARIAWLAACDDACNHARRLADLGVHKQLANRLIEPFAYTTVVVSATEWANFFALRRHPDAQPEMQAVANAMYAAMKDSQPERIHPGWHTPFVDDQEYDDLRDAGYSSDDINLISVGRCARVSYLTHDGRRDPAEDIALAKKLQTSGHMSPFEHVARAMAPYEILFHGRHGQSKPFWGNFCGFVQLRKTLQYEDNFANVLKARAAQ